MHESVRPFGHGGNATGKRLGQRRFIGHGRHLFLPKVKVTTRKRIEVRRRFRHGGSILLGDRFDQRHKGRSYCSAMKNLLPFCAIAKTLVA